MRLWKVLGALALGALSFGLGSWFGSPDAAVAVDLDEIRARIRKAMLTSERLEQTRIILPVLRDMGAEQAPAVAQAFEATFKEGGGGLPLELFVERWASLDPVASRERIANWPPDLRRQAWPVLIGTWALRDPRAAGEALASIADPGVQRSALRPLMTGWGRSGVAGVWGGLAELSDPEVRREVAAFVVQRRLHRDGSVAVLAEIQELPDSPELEALKGLALARTLTHLAEDDLPQVLSIARKYWDTPYADKILRALVTQWAADDGQAALAWLLAEPAGDTRDRALVSAYRRWLQADRHAATRWLERGAGEADLTPLLPAHAASLAREGPEAAIEWASALPGAEVQRRAFVAIGQVWRRADPESADRWLERVGLTAEVGKRRHK